MNSNQSIYPDPNNRPNLNGTEAIKFPSEDQLQDLNQTPKPKKSKLIIVFLIIFILIIILGVFYYLFLPPKWMLYLMSKRLTNIKTVDCISEFKAEFSASDFNSPLLNLENLRRIAGVNTDSNITTADNQRFSGSIIINTNSQLDWTDIYHPKGSFELERFNFTENNNSIEVGSGELRIPDNNIYLKINDISKTIFNFDLSQVKKKWYYVENKEPVIDEKDITQEQINQEKELSKKYQIIKITNKLKSESLNGMPVYHYQYVLDVDATANFLAESAQINDKKMTSKEKEDFIKDFKDTMKGIDIGGEIWIGKFDFYPHKIVATTKIKDDTIPFASGTLTTTLSMKNINKPIKVDVPTGALPYSEFEKVLQEQIMAKYKSNQLQSVTVPSSNNQDSDNDNLTDELEKIYGTNPNNPDTDGDGYKDGDEVKKGYNPNGPGTLQAY